MPQIVLEVTLIIIAAGPVHFAISVHRFCREFFVHRVRTPMAFVHLAIWPVIQLGSVENALSLDVVHFEHAFIEKASFEFRRRIRRQTPSCLDRAYSP